MTRIDLFSIIFLRLFGLIYFFILFFILFFSVSHGSLPWLCNKLSGYFLYCPTVCAQIMKLLTVTFLKYSFKNNNLQISQAKANKNMINITCDFGL